MVHIINILFSYQILCLLGLKLILPQELPIQNTYAVANHNSTWYHCVDFSRLLPLLERSKVSVPINQYM